MNFATVNRASIYNQIVEAVKDGRPLLAILIDPENVAVRDIVPLLERLPPTTTQLLVGGSTANRSQTQMIVQALKKHTSLPVILFPGNYGQITPMADAILFLSLLSGRNPEYLIGQHIKAVPQLKKLSIEIIPTAYLLIEGGKESSVARESGTSPMCRDQVEEIVHTALAGQFSGKKLVYLEAGSGALQPVPKKVIKAVSEAVDIPVIVGGGINSITETQTCYNAGAAMVVVGTAFEHNNFMS